LTWYNLEFNVCDTKVVLKPLKVITLPSQT
jgi:hypothetical protein